MEFFKCEISVLISKSVTIQKMATGGRKEQVPKCYVHPCALFSSRSSLATTDLGKLQGFSAHPGTSSVTWFCSSSNFVQPRHIDNTCILQACKTSKEVIGGLSSRSQDNFLPWQWQPQFADKDFCFTCIYLAETYRIEALEQSKSDSTSSPICLGSPELPPIPASSLASSPVSPWSTIPKHFDGPIHHPFQGHPRTRQDNVARFFIWIHCRARHIGFHPDAHTAMRKWSRIKHQTGNAGQTL